MEGVSTILFQGRVQVDVQLEDEEGLKMTLQIVTALQLREGR